MQHTEETAAAVAKAVEQVNEGWQRKMQQAVNDVALRKWCVEQAMKCPDRSGLPASIAQDMYRFIVEPFRDDKP